MTPDVYLQHAAEAERLARLAGSPEERRTYLALAHTWRDLAARVADAAVEPGSNAD